MNEAETDERLREIVVRLIEEAPDPLPYSADWLPAESAADPISLEDLRPQRELKPRWPILVGGLVAAAAFAAIAGFVIWDRTPNETIVLATPEELPSTVAATPEQPTNTPSEEPVPLDGVWSRVPHSRVFEGGRETWVRSVVAGGPGLVAVGVGGNGRKPGPVAKVWTSVDGLEWNLVPYDVERTPSSDGTYFATFGGRGTFSAMKSVTVGGPGLVAVGSSGSFDSITATSPGSAVPPAVSDTVASLTDDLVATVWTSVDGLEWTRVPHKEETFGAADGATMNSVAAGGPGLVAVGATGAGDQRKAAVWTSVDGFEWTRVPHDEETFGSSGGTSKVMNSVTAGGPGLVAVGVGAQGKAAVWISVGGLEWSRVPTNDETFGSAGGNAVMKSVTAGGPGLVAVGATGAGDQRKATVWTSVDGLEWTRLPHDDETFGGDGGASMSRVIAGGAGLVAVGSTGDIGEDGSGVVWTSVDGLTWLRVVDDESVFSDGSLSDVALTGHGPVTVGVAGGQPGVQGYNTYNAAIWIASIEQ